MPPTLPIDWRFLFCLTLGTTVAMRAEIKTDIEYGTASGVSLRLDASIPEGAGPFPAVILIHGGGWSAGDKSGGPQKGYMAPMHEALTNGGFAWFSINYRLAPDFRYPAQMEDVETAIRWLKKNAASYRVDAQRIAISGESAGGQMAALAAVRGTGPTQVAAAVIFYGMCDFEAETKRRGELSPSFIKLFGRESLDEPMRKLMHEASAINFVKPGVPPFLLVHGTADKSVSYEQSVDMQARLREARVPNELITIKDGPHGMLPWPALAPDFKDRVVAWLQRTLDVPAAKKSP